ncbi:MAG: type II/IV secretion system protein [Gammaproteobacteria bacterium]|nr:type II/IV secretion system protein [Gammaproteobacteria bacterium]
MMQPRQKVRIGDLLVENKVISQGQLDVALAEQKKSGRKLGKVLIENGYLGEDELLTFLSKQLNIPFIDLRHYKFDADTVRLIPEIQARRFRAVALKLSERGVLVGMADPTNIFAYDELAALLKRPVELAVVREADLLRTIDAVYRHTEQITGFAEQLSDELTAGDIDMQELVAAADLADAPVVKLLQSVFEDAVQIKASDIHIEPDETVLRIRQRVDGVLQEHVLNEKRIVQALVLRLKLMGGLDISEKRLPQDGRFSIRVKDHAVDVRLSTMPVQHGESVVMRLLDQTAGVKKLEDLGMPEALRKRFEAVIHRPHGMVLVTGPTGSGKTTTLYAALQILNQPENKIITVEDPVEYRLSRINQVQVNAEIGLTFGRVLRSALRQDPDIILVGEMRDEETAEIGLRAALTGHMVLSTLHTNDAISTVTRLLDMHVPGYMLASALQAIVAQRLVRRVCDACAEPARLDARASAWVRAKTGRNEGRFMHGRGCQYCNNTGYRGRIGVYELLEIDEGIATALTRTDSVEFAALAHRAAGFRPLDLVALEDAARGTTTVEEAMRVSADVADVSVAEALSFGDVAAG